MQVELLQTKSKDFDKLSKIIALRDMYFDFLNSDADNARQLHANLVYQYDMFVFQYGKLNDKTNYPYVTLDIQGPLILSLESPKNGVFDKAEILKQHQPAIQTTSKEQNPKLPLEEAIYFSLNKHNSINLETISQVTKLHIEDVVTEALDRQLLFLNPTGNGIELAPKFQFLSGTIFKKIEFYKRNDFGEFQSYINKAYKDKAVLELEKIKPPITPFEDLDIKIHEPWFSLQIIQAFIYDNYKTIARIAYNESTSKYMVKIETYDYHLVKKFYVRSEHRSFHFKEILEGALNSTIPYVSKGSGDYRRTDKVKMQEIRASVQGVSSVYHRQTRSEAKLGIHFLQFIRFNYPPQI
jgi:N12 class adenine-specific DNA methylase